MAKTTRPKKNNDGSAPVKKGEPVISNYSGNEIIHGDPNDPDVHDGQAWREGRAVGDPPNKKE